MAIVGEQGGVMTRQTLPKDADALTEALSTQKTAVTSCRRQTGRMRWYLFPAQSSVKRRREASPPCRLRVPVKPRGQPVFISSGSFGADVISARTRQLTLRIMPNRNMRPPRLRKIVQLSGLEKMPWKARLFSVPQNLPKGKGKKKLAGFCAFLKKKDCFFAFGT